MLAAEDAKPKIEPVPSDEWLIWMDERPHTLLAAESGGGKSVFASVIVDRRARERGDHIAILDPHWSPLIEADEGRLVPKWGGIKPSAQSHAEIRAALRALRQEYDRRLEQLRKGEVVEGHFEPKITVVIDEVPEVCQATISYRTRLASRKNLTLRAIVASRKS